MPETSEAAGSPLIDRDLKIIYSSRAKALLK